MNFQDRFNILKEQYDFNLEQHRLELETKRQEYELQISLHRTLFTNAENQLRDLQTSHQKLCQENLNLIRQLQIKENQLRDLSQRPTEQQNQQQIDQQTQLLQQRINELASDLKTANLNNQTLKDNLEKNNKKMSENMLERLRFEREINQLKGQLNDLREQNNNQAINRNLQQQNEDMKSKLANLQQADESMRARINTLSEENLSLQQQVKQLQEQKVQIQNENQQIKKNNEDLLKLMKQEPKGTLYTEMLSLKDQEIQKLKSKVQSLTETGTYNYYLPQDSRIAQVNTDIVRQFHQQISEDINNFESYPIEDLSGRTIGISLISKTASQQFNSPPAKMINNFM